MMIGWSMPTVTARRAPGLPGRTSRAGRWRRGSGPTSASSRCSRANCRSSTRTAEPSSVSRHARSRKTPDMVLSSTSKPLSLRSATSAPLSAGCSHARELMSVSTTRERAGFFSPDAMGDPDVRRRESQPFDEDVCVSDRLPRARPPRSARAGRPRTPRRAPAPPSPPRRCRPPVELLAEDVRVARVPARPAWRVSRASGSVRRRARRRPRPRGRSPRRRGG